MRNDHAARCTLQRACAPHFAVIYAVRAVRESPLQELPRASFRQLRHFLIKIHTAAIAGPCVAAFSSAMISMEMRKRRVARIDDK